MNARTRNARNAGLQQSAQAGASAIPHADKRLDRMDRLADMGHFPALVNAGATANILVTITATYFLESWLLGGGAVAAYAPAGTLVPAPFVWTALVLALNLTPVLVLRFRDRLQAQRSPARPIPRLREMDFVRDQHRFSDWVYLAASANMAFWILLSWTVFLLHHTVAALLTMLVVSFAATFSPVLLRSVSKS